MGDTTNNCRERIWSYGWEGLMWQCVSLANLRLNTLNTASVCLAVIRRYVWLLAFRFAVATTQWFAAELFLPALFLEQVCLSWIADHIFSTLVSYTHTEWERERESWKWNLPVTAIFQFLNTTAPEKKCTKALACSFSLFSCQYASLVFWVRMFPLFLF